MANWKATTISWVGMQDFNDDDLQMKFLSQREISILHTALTMFYWPTRWDELGESADTLSERMSRIDLRLEEDVNFCEYVEECIRDHPGVKRALQDAIKGSLKGAIQEYLDSECIGNLTCDRDELYGYSVALWGYIHQRNVDFLEMLDAATNVYEQMSTLLSFIPGFELLPIDDILQWVANLGEYALDAYNSSYTVAKGQEIECDIMCMAYANGCSVTFGDVYEYLIEKIGGTNAPTVVATFAEWVAFMALGVYPSDRIIYLWSAFQLGMAVIGFEFGDTSGIDNYRIQALAGEEDDAWELLCDTCVGEIGSVTFDSVDDLSYTLSYGSVVSAVGNPDNCLEGEEWFEAPFTTGKRAAIKIDLGDDFTVTQVTFDWHYNTFSTGDCARHVRLYDDGDVLLDSWALTDNPDQNTWHNEDNPEFNEADVRYVVVELMFNSDYTGSRHLYVDNIVIIGQLP